MRAEEKAGRAGTGSHCGSSWPENASAFVPGSRLRTERDDLERELDAARRHVSDLTHTKDALQAVFDQHPIRDPRVVVGPRVGEDAAVIDVGDRYLVATADPVTFAADDVARYALVVNANDVAVRGARPLNFMELLRMYTINGRLFTVPDIKDRDIKNNGDIRRLYGPPRTMDSAENRGAPPKGNE